MLLLEPLWRPDGACKALLAHLPAEHLPLLAEALADSPLACIPCYWFSPEGKLPPGLPPTHSLEAAAPAGIEAPDTIRCLVSANTPLTESPSIVTSLNDPAQLLPLQGHDTLVCGTWITAKLPESTPNPAQPVLLELLGLIVRDAETFELERVFAKAPQLTVSLLRLVNSVALASRYPTESLRQAITLLGRRQLQRWLQLLLYAEQYGPDGLLPPLLTAAALRAKRLEFWAKAGWLPGISPDSAFLCGMLSLIDRLFGKPLSELLSPLPLPQTMLDGLLSGTGEMGEAILCLELCEAGNVAALGHKMRQKIDARQREWTSSEINAFAWALSLHGGHAP